MLTAAEALAKLIAYKSGLGIPEPAELTLLEKRAIELGDSGELPEAGDAEESIPAYTERLAWIGRFVHEFLYWELALDRQGTLIRLRKSR